MTKQQILEVLEGKYVADRATKTLNLSILMDSRQSIPEHTDFAMALDELITQIAELDDKIETVQSLMKMGF